VKLCLLTVPHTGTKFTERMFWDLGYHAYAMVDDPKDDKALFGGHTVLPDQVELAKRLIEDRGFPLIVTLRHPYLVEKSWIGRNKSVPNMINAFYVLGDLIKEYDPYVLPVDSPVREHCLELMREGLNLNLRTNWKPTNISQSTYELSPDEVTPSPEVQQMVTDLYPILVPYYDLKADA